MPSSAFFSAVHFVIFMLRAMIISASMCPFVLMGGVAYEHSGPAIIVSYALIASDCTHLRLGYDDMDLVFGEFAS